MGVRLGSHNKPVLSLTSAQERAIQFAMKDGGELQIGGAAGRPVRRNVAARLESLGILECMHSPTVLENCWKYSLVSIAQKNSNSASARKQQLLKSLPVHIQAAIYAWVSPPRRNRLRADEREKALRLIQNIAHAWEGECLSPAYLGIQKHLIFRCSKNHEWSRTPATLLAGYFCPKCESRNIKTLRRLKAWAAARGWVCLSSSFESGDAPMQWRCDQGHEWTNSSRTVRQCQGCPECYRQRHYHTLETMHQVARERGGLCLSISYTNVDHKITWQCERGHSWEAPPSRIMLGSWCPVCARMARVKKSDSAAHFKSLPSQKQSTD